jgi:hypothetical protein
MSVFIGGSAYNMVRDIADGFVVVSERTFRNYGRKELADFAQEINRLLQEVRSAQPDSADIAAVQKRQRRMQRLLQALTLANAAVSRRT